MKKLLIGVTTILISCSTTIAQKDLSATRTLTPENSDIEGKVYGSSSWELLKGTYQLMVSENSYKPLFSKSLYDVIVSSRKEEEDITIIVDEYTTLYLPSKTKISNSGFQALDPIQYSTK
jgi:hypothetical protein